ncbi:hypothetical protein B0H14DRAFT_3497236 [Mycena olivaceomarginata]|nr:hypothetical protein B0H14DRAFT_3497236 [Mycena olivaceomarginata]
MSFAGGFLVPRHDPQAVAQKATDQVMIDQLFAATAVPISEYIPALFTLLPYLHTISYNDEITAIAAAMGMTLFFVALMLLTLIKYAVGIADSSIPRPLRNTT